MTEAFLVPRFVAGPPPLICVNLRYFLFGSPRPLKTPPLISVKVRYFQFGWDTKRLPSFGLGVLSVACFFCVFFPFSSGHVAVCTSATPFCTGATPFSLPGQSLKRTFAPSPNHFWEFTIFGLSPRTFGLQGYSRKVPQSCKPNWERVGEHPKAIGGLCKGMLDPWSKVFCTMRTLLCTNAAPACTSAKGFFAQLWASLKP